MSESFSLQRLGWRPFYSHQLTLEDLEVYYPARIASVHRGGVDALSEHGSVRLAVPREMQRDGVGATLTVGDWVLAERAAARVRRRLNRLSAIVRVAAGSKARLQAVAANLDTLFVVTSCNRDFNPSRLERYMAVALEAGVEPIILLTKTDLCADVSRYVAGAERSALRARVLALNATSPSDVVRLEPWLAFGRTVAFVGSSGVGKSTLVNALTGCERQATAPIREDDSRGRHTTTVRELIPTAGGAWLIDTPGMRELGIGALGEGVGSAFDDITALAQNCRFRDCSHDGDDGCALLAAVTAGRLDPRRLRSYLKLQREARRAARTKRERHEDERRMGKLYKEVQAQRRGHRDG